MEREEETKTHVIPLWYQSVFQRQGHPIFYSPNWFAFESKKGQGEIPSQTGWNPSLDIYLDCSEQTRTCGHLVYRSPWASSSEVSHRPQPESPPGRFLMVIHTEMRQPPWASACLFMGGDYWELCLGPLLRIRETTLQVLSASWCTVNRDCYCKCMRPAEGLHGTGLRIRRQISQRERICPVTDSSIIKLGTWGSGGRRKFTSIVCSVLLILDFVNYLY